MSQIDSLSRCLVTFDPDRSMTVVVELKVGATEPSEDVPDYRVIRRRFRA